MKKKLQKTTLLVIAFFCNFTAVHAQKNYESGFLVLNNADTVKGWIDNKDWEKSPKTIHFKKDLSASAEDYSADAVRWFYLNESKILYKGLVVVVDKDPVATSQLAKEYVHAESIDTIFAKVLVIGAASLYHSYDFKHHFFVEKGPIVEVIKERRLGKDALGKEITLTFNRYKYQLGGILSDCKTLTGAIEKTSFNQKSMQALILQYNDCKGSKAAYVKTREKTKKEFGIITAAVKTGMDIKTGSVSLNYLDPMELESVLTPSFGAFLNIYLPGRRESISIYNELHYKSYDVTGTYQTENTSYTTDYTHHSDMAYLSYLVGGRYKFPAKGIQPFIQGGLMADFNVKQNVHTTIQRTGSSNDSPETETYSTKSYELGLWAGAGVKMKRFTVDVRYTKPDGWSPSLAIEVDVNHLYFAVSYSLTK